MNTTMQHPVRQGNSYNHMLQDNGKQRNAAIAASSAFCTRPNESFRSVSAHNLHAQHKDVKY